MKAHFLNNCVYRLTILLIDFLSFFLLNAQDSNTIHNFDKVEFQHLGERQGVNKFVSIVFHDSRGFIWFGTLVDGLYKYDGFEIKKYNYNYNDPESLIGNSIVNIFLEDRSGNLWINAGSHHQRFLHRYNRSSDNFTRFIHNHDDSSSICDGTVSSAVEDHKGNIWIGSYGSKFDKILGGLSMFERVSGKFIRYNIKSENPFNQPFNGVTSMYVDNSGVLWVGTHSGEIVKIFPDNNALAEEFIYYKHESDKPASLLNFTVWDITEDKYGSIWFGTYGGGLLRYEHSKDKICRYLVHPDKFSDYNSVRLLSLDPDGELWLGTEGGLAKYERINDTIIRYCHIPDDSSSITSGYVSAIAHDAEGSTWIITNDGWFTEGINRFDRKTGKFHLYQHNSLDPTSLSTNLLNTAVVDRNGILWIGTLDAGIDKFDPVKRKFDLYKCMPDSPVGIPEGRIYSFCEDSEGILWIGTHDYGLFRFDRKAGNISNYTFDPKNPKSINNNTIIDICKGPPGTLWLGGLGGLKKLNTETMEFRHFIHNPVNPNSISGDHIMFIYRDRSGILWISTLNNGLNCFDPDTEKFKLFNKDPDNPESLNTNSVFSIYEDFNGTIWLGSIDGLFKYIPGNNGNSDKFHQYKHDINNPNSLSYNSVRSIIEDSSGNLWLGTEGGGLNKFNIKNETFTIYTMQDGLPSNTIWGILMDEKGNLWMSTNNGLSRFIPETKTFVNYDQSDGLQGLQFNFMAYFKSRTGEMFFGGDKGINYFYPESVINNPNVPSVVITDLKLFNKSIDVNENFLLKKSISEVKELELKHNENFISIEFVALNFTNSHKNQYKYLMIGLDKDTVYAGTRRFADYPDMKPGEYTFWVTGSNNDGVWNKEGVSLQINIIPPFWQNDLAFFIYAILLTIFVIAYVKWKTWRLRRDKESLELQVKERILEIEKKDLQIMEIDRMKIRFFANISHEFRTPLTLILSPLEELIMNNNFGDKVQNKLNAIRRNGLRLLDLVNQLLDFSKLDSGKLKLELSEADMIKTLRLIFSSFISLADKKRIHYIFQLPDGDLITYFDRSKLEIIMNNLLSNAFKYTPEDGEIRCNVQIKLDGEEVINSLIEISVRDSGPGIDENNLELIFDRFYHADEKHRIEVGGTGIGLSLTKELVQLFHGEINVVSESGKGSCFTVSFPLGKDHFKESEYIIVKPEFSPVLGLTEETIDEIGIDMVVPNEPGSEKKPLQLLIVEDNLELRSFIKEMFQMDFTIDEASDGEEGLRKAILTIPDLIITDVMMPVMDGIGLCKRLKTIERTNHIPVIILTAKADMESKLKGLETEADDYIIKPFNIGELKTKVKNLIVQRQKLRKRFENDLRLNEEDMIFNSYDVQFINRLVRVIEDHIADFDFDVRMLQRKVGLDYNQLYRKLFALTGLTPTKFIRKQRCQYAARLMEQRFGNVTKIAYKVGFNNLSWFAKCFKEFYGISPSDYCRQFSE